MTRLITITFLLLWINCFSLSLNAQDLQYKNETIYLTELVTHTSENEGQKIDLIGWFLNNSMLSLGEKHSLNLGLMLTHGGEPSADIVGDLQTFSNLEAGSLYGFFEMYYQYKMKGFWLKLGQQDLNTDFFVSENALLFTHSSFGIDPVATINMPAPTYPPTAVAFTTGIDLNQQIKLKLGIFDGQFARLNGNFLTINWNLNGAEGLLYLVEPEFELFKGRLTQKVGYFYHSGRFTNRETNGNETGMSAFYLVSDLLLSEMEDKTTNLFFQFNTSTKSVSDVNYYYGLGLRLTNYVTGKPNEIGFAIGHAALNNEFGSVRAEYNLKSETILELNYKQELSSLISLQPYLQWIGMDEIVKTQRNPLILALRAYIEF